MTRRLEIWDVRWDRKLRVWRWYRPGAVGGVLVGGKEETVRAAAALAQETGRPISLRIHDKAGRFQEERTYPRSADPKRSPG